MRWTIRARLASRGLIGSSVARRTSANNASSARSSARSAAARAAALAWRARVVVKMSLDSEVLGAAIKVRTRVTAFSGVAGAERQLFQRDWADAVRLSERTPAATLQQRLLDAAPATLPSPARPLSHFPPAAESSNDLQKAALRGQGGSAAKLLDLDRGTNGDDEFSSDEPAAPERVSSPRALTPPPPPTVAGLEAKLGPPLAIVAQRLGHADTAAELASYRVNYQHYRLGGATGARGEIGSVGVPERFDTSSPRPVEGGKGNNPVAAPGVTLAGAAATDPAVVAYIASLEHKVRVLEAQLARGGSGSPVRSASPFHAPRPQKAVAAAVINSLAMEDDKE